MATNSIEGHIDSRYSSIADAFADNFKYHNEIGVSFCVYHNHEKVIDIWSGHRDQKRSLEWNKDTVVPFFSTSKAVSACCLAICHSRGLFDYQDKVSDYWKEFAANGKEQITIEQLFQHRTGLSAIDKKLDASTIRNRPLLEQIIAKQKPHWTPGDYQGYHPWNIGWYTSALLSKFDPKQRRLKEFLEEEVLPHISGELRIGIDKNYSIEHLAQLITFSKWKVFSMPFVFAKEFFKPWSLTFKSMLNPSFVVNHANFNKKEVLELEIGGGGGFGNARGLASLFDGIMNPGHPLWLGEETLDYLSKEPAAPAKGYRDMVLKLDLLRFHAGFVKPSDKHDFCESRKAFGGFGAGGSFIIADPEHKLSFAYTMNRMDHKLMNIDREVNLRNAVYQAVKRL